MQIYLFREALNEFLRRIPTFRRHFLHYTTTTCLGNFKTSISSGLSHLLFGTDSRSFFKNHFPFTGKNIFNFDIVEIFKQRCPTFILNFLSAFQKALITSLNTKIPGNLTQPVNILSTSINLMYLF